MSVLWRTFSLVILVMLWFVAAEAAGPPATQEVQAVGVGATSDEAYKQAIKDAVTQVVGALVTSETAIRNDRLIREDVLTLSNGFVDKVLQSDQKKQDDGSWLVRLTCVVRKGELCGTLRQKKIPTVSFDGESLFADVVSQLNHEQDVAALLQDALLQWNGEMFTATCTSDKPSILERNNSKVQIRLACRITLRRDLYEGRFLPKMTNVLAILSTGKVDHVLTSYESQNHYLSGERIIYLEGAPGGYVFNAEHFRDVLGKARTQFFGEESVAPLWVFAIFRDASDECLLIRHRSRMLSCATQATRFGFSLSLSPRIRGDRNSQPADALDFEFDTELPLEYLQRITRIELHVSAWLDSLLNFNLMKPGAPGGFVTSRSETGWFFKFAKPDEKEISVWNNGDSYYLPTLRLSGQSVEFTTRK